MHSSIHSRVDRQVSLLMAIMLTIAIAAVYCVCIYSNYTTIEESLERRFEAVHAAVENRISHLDEYGEIYSRDDMDTEAYIYVRERLQEIREAVELRYLYTAARNDQGELIYMVDGLPLKENGEPEDPEDYRYPGDLIEEEIQDYVARALNGETITSSEIMGTNWGAVVVAYYPIRNSAGEVIYVLGMEYSATQQLLSFRNSALASLVVGIIIIVVSSLIARSFFRRISNPLYKDLSTTDFLTNLKNRNTYEVDIQNLIQQNQNKGIAIGMMDLNDLKKLNDGYGHEMGDRYLAQMGQILEKRVSKDTWIYRYGGDEFAFIFFNPDDAVSIEEKISADFTVRMKDMPIPVSFAFAYAVFDEAMDVNLLNTRERADEAMYRRKADMKQHAGG